LRDTRWPIREESYPWLFLSITCVSRRTMRQGQG
jgi:hypothetical protein